MKLATYVSVAALLGAVAASPIPHGDWDETDRYDWSSKSDGQPGCRGGRGRKCRPWIGEPNELHQYSNIAALTAGVAADGTLIKDVLKYGGLGLGTFGGLRGEMIVLDGIVYHGLPTGEIATPDPTTTETPFMAVTNFAPEAEATVSIANLSDFSAQLPTWFGNVSIRNQFVSYRMDGTFTLRIRAPPGQAYPLEDLASVSSRQIEWSHANLTGTMVGFHTPQYAAQVNAAGDHLHFISEDRRIGGHVLEFHTVGDAHIQLSRMTRYHVEVPTDGEFSEIDLE